MLKRQRILIVDQTFQTSAVSAKWLTVTTDANQGVIYKTQPDQIDSISSLRLTLCLYCAV